MHGNQLECNPWTNLIKAKKSGLSLCISFRIPLQVEVEQMKNERDFNRYQNVMNWIQSQISTRVIVLGAPASGKSTFIRLVADQSKFPTENIATDGIAITNVNKITFWDFGGQEVLFSTHKFFLVDRCQYVLVVDLSKLIHKDEKIRNKYLKVVDFWMKEIQTFTLNHQHSPPVLFLGTHCDLIDKFFSISKVEKGILALFKLAKSNHLNCVRNVFKFYKSSKESTLNKNISSILQEIQTNSEKFTKKQFGLLKNENIIHSFQFCILRHNIQIESKTKPFMMRNEFENLFFDVKKESKEKIDKFTKLLKLSGTIETYRFESSAASEIIFLDPKWLSQTFTSIISIKMQSSKNRRGFFTRNQIENNLKNQEIPEHIWDEIIKIFEMFHLIVVLPSGEYYVPAMLHTPKSTKPSHLGRKKNELVIDTFKENNIKYKYIRRKYEFSPRIPFGFIDKLIVKYLHFPGMTMHESTSTNDFYLYSKEDGNYDNRFYHLLVQVINIEEDSNDLMNTELVISVFYPESEEDHLYFSFFCHFIFQSPHDILTSSVHSSSLIENIFILGENLQNLDSIGDEKTILFNFREYSHFRKYFISSDIKVYDNEIHKCKLIKKLGSGAFGQVYLGNMKFNLSTNIKHDVVFKETKFVSYESLRNLINECMMMKINSQSDY